MPEKSPASLVLPLVRWVSPHSGIYLSPVPLVTDYSGRAQLLYVLGSFESKDAEFNVDFKNINLPYAKKTNM
jgi:hypothetical protein